MPEHPGRLLNVYLSDDGRYAVIAISEAGPENMIYYMDLNDPLKPSMNAPVVRLIDQLEASFNPIGNDGTFSYSAHDSGSCSHHGGVAVFYV